MRTLKKNQIVVFVIGLMIITAGYLSYSNNSDGANNGLSEASMITDSEEMASIGDAKLVSGEPIDANQVNNLQANEINTNNDEVSANLVENATQTADLKGEDTNTINSNELHDVENIDSNTLIDDAEKTEETNSSELSDSDYFTNSRLNRDTMYSQRIENYQDLLNNTNVSEAQKKIAQEEITKLNNEQNAIMIAENIIKTKGVDDLIILVNGDSVNVVVGGEELEKETIAQIQNIITRELGTDIGNIHIMNK